MLVKPYIHSKVVAVSILIQFIPEILSIYADAFISYHC